MLSAHWHTMSLFLHEEVSDGRKVFSVAEAQSIACRDGICKCTRSILHAATIMNSPSQSTLSTLSVASAPAPRPLTPGRPPARSLQQHRHQNHQNQHQPQPAAHEEPLQWAKGSCLDG
jgi:hypothetical protein